MAAPNDISGLRALVESGEIVPANIVGLMGKTEGNGEVNDFTRAFAESTFKRYLGEQLGCTDDEVAERVCMVMSGGTTGLLSPHVTVFQRQDLPDDTPPADSKRLAIGVAHSVEIKPEEIGRIEQVYKIEAAVHKALEHAGLDPSDVHFVQVKNPSLTVDRINDAKSRGKTVVTENLALSMNRSNDAAALGVALALGEFERDRLTPESISKDFSLYSNVTSSSAGIEKVRADVLVFGNSDKAVSDFRIGSSILEDMIDTDGYRRALRAAGLEFEFNPSEEQCKRIVNIFQKIKVPGSGYLRGRRFTMMDDSAVGRKACYAIGSAVAATVIGDPMVYVSGGGVDGHQGPPGGSPVAAIIRV